MFKNLEIWATEKCNSRCIMCHAWRQKAKKRDLLVDDLKKLLKYPAFKEVCDIQISGGEPTERSDLFKFIMAAVECLPKLNKILLATNGTRPAYTAGILKKIKKETDIELKLCVSLDGNRSVNKKNRGVDNYNSAIKTLRLIRELVPSIKPMILTTLTSLNCNNESLEHINKIVKENHCDFSYRIAYNSPHHWCGRGLIPDKRQKLEVIKFTKKYFPDNLFLTLQNQYLINGENLFMNHCRAGELFANIRSDGKVYPCINSRRKIGSVKEGIFTKNYKLGKYEQCSVCCEEASFYPNYNHGNLKKRKDVFKL